MSKKRGAGSLYRQPGCKTWMISFYQNGKQVRESTGQTDYQAARQKLNQRLGKIAAGEVVDVRLERVSVKDLADEVLRDYRINSKKSIDDVEARWRLHIEPVFGHLRAMHVTTQALNQYVDARKAEGAENATINREMAFLKRAFNLGYRSTPRKVQFVPAFPRLKENPPRKGFIEDAHYKLLASNCSELWLRTMLALAYNFGLRREELLNLRVRQFNETQRTLSLDPGTTKNDDARHIVLTRESLELLKACVDGKKADHYILTRKTRKGSNQRVKDFRVAWFKLCVKAGLGEMRCSRCSSVSSSYRKQCATCKGRLSYHGLILHDNRRSAVRRMVRNGIPERVAMTISGHKTRSVFDRYNITSQADLRDAASKLERGTEFLNNHDFNHDAPKTEQSQSEAVKARVI
ncbi:MAG TPA: tyrosine-type recombinase/integrase [Terriglobales bacterium]|nr:tyrosine-type recombinase/integrase [Terriglobales bacterium]